VAFPIGTRIPVTRLGAGLPKIVPDTGVTLRLPSGINPKRYMGALVKKTADETAANYGAGKTVPWDGEDHDTDGFHDNSSNNDRLIIPANLGIVGVSLFCGLWVTNLADVMSFYLSWSTGGGAATDSFVGNAMTRAPVLGNISYGNCRTLCNSVSANDYFQVNAYMGSDTSVTIDAAHSSFGIKVEKIDAQGYIISQYGSVELLKIGTDEWMFSDQSSLG
jgi:hypothetical protein